MKNFFINFLFMIYILDERVVLADVPLGEERWRPPKRRKASILNSAQNYRSTSDILLSLDWSRSLFGLRIGVPKHWNVLVYPVVIFFDPQEQRWLLPAVSEALRDSNQNEDARQLLHGRSTAVQLQGESTQSCVYIIPETCVQLLRLVLTKPPKAIVDASFIDTELNSRRKY